MKSRAAVLVEQGRPMIIDEIEIPDPAPTQVIVKQFASGVCHSQLHALHNPATPTPMVTGHESTGLVVAKGADVTHVQEGDRVMVTWVQRDAFEGKTLPQPARTTFHGHPINFAPPAVTGVYTWSDLTIADEQFIVKFTESDIAMDVTAIIGCAVMTGCGAALHSARVAANSSVAVIGVGGVGLCIIQACANVSAHPIIAVDLSAEKLEFAQRFGATIGVNASEVDAVAAIREITGGGADFAFDAIGVAKSMEQALAAARPGVTGLRDGGMAVLVGVPHGDPPVLNMREIFGGKTYRGAPGGSSRPQRDFAVYERWFKQGKLPLDLLITRRYTLDQINEACADLEAGRILGRAIVDLT